MVQSEAVTGFKSQLTLHVQGCEKLPYVVSVPDIGAEDHGI